MQIYNIFARFLIVGLVFLAFLAALHGQLLFAFLFLISVAGVAKVISNGN